MGSLTRRGFISQLAGIFAAVTLPKPRWMPSESAENSHVAGTIIEVLSPRQAWVELSPNVLIVPPALEQRVREALFPRDDCELLVSERIPEGDWYYVYPRRPKPPRRLAYRPPRAKWRRRF